MAAERAVVLAGYAGGSAAIRAAAAEGAISAVECAAMWAESQHCEALADEPRNAKTLTALIAPTAGSRYWAVRGGLPIRGCCHARHRHGIWTFG